MPVKSKQRVIKKNSLKRKLQISQNSKMESSISFNKVKRMVFQEPYEEEKLEIQQLMKPRIVLPNNTDKKIQKPGPSKRPKIDDQAQSETPSFWRDVSSLYFREISAGEIKPIIESIQKITQSEEEAHAKESQKKGFKKKSALLKEKLEHQRDILSQRTIGVENKEDFSFLKSSQTGQSRRKREVNRHLEFFSQVANDRRSLQNQASKEETIRYGPLFSFFDYYQDFINDLGFFADPSDQREVELLRKNYVQDPHLKFEENTESIMLLGYELIAAQPRGEDYSPDFFINNHMRKTSQDSISGVEEYSQLSAKGSLAGNHMLINEQLQWLETELQLTQAQVAQKVTNLEEKINSVQDEERDHLKVQLQSNEKLMQHFIETLIIHEAKQFADSIARIKAKKLMPSTYSDHRDTQKLPYLFRKKRFRPRDLSSRRRQYEFLIEFDPSLDLPATWITERELNCINKLREDINSNSLYRGQGVILRPMISSDNSMKAHTCAQGRRTEKKPAILEKELSRSLEMVEQVDHGFCHHCKQLKTTYIMAHCRYNSQKHGMLMPVQQTVNGVTLYNVEPRQTSLINHLILRKAIKDKKKRALLENEQPLTCSKQFCSFCLKNYYDIIIQVAQNNPDWVCPYCTGQCFCSRCMRQDQMTRVRAYLISTAMDQIQNSCQVNPSDIMIQLQESDNLLDQLIKSNFNRVARIATLSPQSALSDLELPEKDSPLFMSDFSLDKLDKYLLPDIDLMITDESRIIDNQQYAIHSQLISTYAEFFKHESEVNIDLEDRYQTLVSEVLGIPKLSKCKEDPREIIFDDSTPVKKRDLKQNQKETHQKPTIQHIENLFTSQKGGISGGSFQSESKAKALNLENQPLNILDSIDHQQKFAPIEAVKSGATTVSHDLPKEGNEEDFIKHSLSPRSSPLVPRSPQKPPSISLLNILYSPKVSQSNPNEAKASPQRSTHATSP